MLSSLSFPGYYTGALWFQDVNCDASRLQLCADALAGACRPIDFVAAGITGVLSHHRSGFDAYHVVNPHWDDGVSLDAIVSWVAEAHGGVRHIQDYSQWCLPPPSPAPTTALAWRAHSYSMLLFAW